MTRVRTFMRYLTPDDDRGYSEAFFCGNCNLEIENCYGYARTPENLMRGDWHGRDDDDQFRYYAFCPWCSTRLDDEWWKDRTIENERAVDHYRNPGHHSGDSHLFTGESPDCVAGHVLSSSATSGEVCWCGPEVIPSLLGCEIRHMAGMRGQAEA